MSSYQEGRPRGLTIEPPSNNNGIRRIVLDPDLRPVVFGSALTLFRKHWKKVGILPRDIKEQSAAFSEKFISTNPLDLLKLNGEGRNKYEAHMIGAERCIKAACTLSPDFKANIEDLRTFPGSKSRSGVKTS